MENICEAAMAFFANAHKGDMRIDSGIDSAESTVSIYTEEQSSVNSLSDSLLTSSLSISSISQNSASDSRAVSADTSTQSNYDTYVNTPNNNDNNNNNNNNYYYPPNDPQTDNTSSDNAQSSASDSSSQVEDDTFHYIWNSQELDDGNTAFAVYDDGSLYSADGKKLIYVCPEDNNYRYPDGVEEIGNYAFSGTELSSLAIPEGIKIIGEKAFYNGYGYRNTLIDIELPDSITEIKAYAFYAYDGRSIRAIIPYNTKSVGENAFNNVRFAIYAADAQIDEGIFLSDARRHAAASLDEYNALIKRYKETDEYF